MKRINTQLIGLLMIAAGVFMLLSNWGIFGIFPSFIWVWILFALGAAVWQGRVLDLPFPARLVSFIAIGVLAIVTAEDFAGAAATGFPAMAFVLTYLQNNKNWWAIIPGGVLTSVTGLIFIEEVFPWDGVPFMLLGFAATFTLLYLRPNEKGGQRWAIYPALGLIIITVISNDPSGHAPGWLLPLILIAAGGGLLGWWRKRERRDDDDS